MVGPQRLGVDGIQGQALSFLTPLHYDVKNTFVNVVIDVCWLKILAVVLEIGGIFCQKIAGLYWIDPVHNSLLTPHLLRLLK